MKYFTLVVSLAALIVVVVWAYNVNYQTRQAYQRLADLRAEIAAEGEALQVLRVEWAWLNSPARLQALVDAYEDELQLTHLRADHFSYPGSVPFPPRPPLVLDPEELWPIAPELAAAPELPLLPFPVPRPRSTGSAQWGDQ
ncbi:MAG: cell division protein FtsL [Pseudomonadota bacterium]